ncbi:MAG: hypothetical protein A2776_00430 [Candidatus Levybacteria bacterium RIFCSPHIGHO2_01_FULL_40_10]|nr:MAG: hypothetical protein A2776_00430 [Candidatus Levybacteria bacterium RIFCSPHIGHO2_01_FULL_40_10]
MGTRLFVAGLPYEVKDDQLQDYFAKVGQVTSAKVITDRYTGRSKGFGFVEMSTPEEAQKAIDELNGTTFISRQIIVKEAYPMKDRGDNAGGGAGSDTGDNNG